MVEINMLKETGCSDDFIKIAAKYLNSQNPADLGNFIKEVEALHAKTPLLPFEAGMLMEAKKLYTQMFPSASR